MPILTNIKFQLYETITKIPDMFDDYFDPDRAAVVELDMHRGHLDESPDTPCPSGPRGREAIELTNRFNEKCRELGIPIIHVEMVLRRGNIDEARKAAWRRIFPLLVEGGLPNAPAHNIEGSKWTEFVVDVKPEDFIVKTKKRMSGFYATDLEFLLRQLDRDTVVITGIFTDCCDLNTGFDAENRDYKILFPANITRGFTVENEEASKRIFSLYIGLVVNDQELIDEWKAQRSIKEKKSA